MGPLVCPFPQDDGLGMRGAVLPEQEADHGHTPGPAHGGPALHHGQVAPVRAEVEAALHEHIVDGDLDARPLKSPKQRNQ